MECGMIKKYEDGIGREMLLVQSTERCVLDKKLHFSIKYKNNFKVFVLPAQKLVKHALQISVLHCLQ